MKSRQTQQAFLIYCYLLELVGYSGAVLVPTTFQ